MILYYIILYYIIYIVYIYSHVYTVKAFSDINFLGAASFLCGEVDATPSHHGHINHAKSLGGRRLANHLIGDTSCTVIYVRLSGQCLLALSLKQKLVYNLQVVLKSCNFAFYIND